MPFQIPQKSSPCPAPKHARLQSFGEPGITGLPMRNGTVSTLPLPAVPRLPLDFLQYCLAAAAPPQSARGC
jgi:hypothetical protein